jgi:hypothetical protein
MVKLQIVSKEERKLWNEMHDTLRRRNSYHLKKQYYPFNIDKWEHQNKEIESTYRSQILALISERQILEKVQQETRRETEAADALLLLAETAKKEFLRSERLKEKKRRQLFEPTTIKVRRSERIYERGHT